MPKKKLKIATMVTGHFTTPPPKGTIYAPMDIATEVIEGLASRGHRVDFYGPKGTKVMGAKVIDCGLEALQGKGRKILGVPGARNIERDKIFGLWDQYLIAEMFMKARKEGYDLLHVHPIDRALPIALACQDVKTVYTLHDPIYPWRADIFKMFESANQGLVSISNSQRKPAPDLNYLDTVYNGIKMDEFKFSDSHDNYLLFVGRITPEKGVAEAVEAAVKAKEKMIIIGPAPENEYWNDRIKPYLGKDIIHLGYVPRRSLFKYYRRAKALLFPIQWEEAFGLVMTEAMACGTPVIGFRRGSVPEVVADKKTGFIVKDVNQMAEAIGKLGLISRADCRRRVEENFSTEKMVEGYEKVFLDFA
ncbi:MAG: glycosyltransferase [Candidatus Colwellbacteria bacterium]|nr:glycosyltransferase [Candidatus Colwellbacteria bacterium]